MIRKIIEINEDKCNGCGLCADACHEGAIGMVDGKAKLLRDDYCDGLGNCLPVCPTGAISFTEREAAAFVPPAAGNGEDVTGQESEKDNAIEKMPLNGGCPGSNVHRIERTDTMPSQGGCPGSNAHSIQRIDATVPLQESGSKNERQQEGDFIGTKQVTDILSSELRQWPVQIKLVPVNAPYFDDANLLIAADCAAYARVGFHAEFMRRKITLIGCPKLDDVDYSEKLTEIIRSNHIKSLTIVRMEVPCCGGIEHAAVTALKDSGKFIPWQVVTLTTDGKVKND